MHVWDYAGDVDGALESLQVSESFEGVPGYPPLRCLGLFAHPPQPAASPPRQLQVEAPHLQVNPGQVADIPHGSVQKSWLPNVDVK